MTDATTKKKTKRRARDDYPTPPEAIEPLLGLIDWSRVNTFFEPCRGSAENYLYRAARIKMVDRYGGISAALKARAIDWCEVLEGRDYLSPVAEASVDLIITNPPFTYAQAFLEKSLRQAATVCYLLPLGFLASNDRQSFWRSNPPTHLAVLSSRPCFVWVCSSATCNASGPRDVKECAECGGKMRRQTDLADVGWYIWDRGRLLNTRAPFIWI